MYQQCWNRTMTSTENQKSSVNYNDVARAAIDMIQQGIKPSVRKVMLVTGGKTDTVSKFLRDFNDKRAAEILTMSDEIGSSNIAKLLADEMITVVDRKTSNLQDLIKEQKIHIDEYVSLLEEVELEAQNRIELAESKMTLAIDEAKKRADLAEARIQTAEKDRDTALANCEKVESRCKSDIDKAESEATALVNEITKQLEKAETETKSLREQVKSLSIDAAKRDIESEQHAETKQQLETMREQLADQKTNIVKLTALEAVYQKDITRLETESEHAKKSSEELARVQGQLVELQKQISQQENELASLKRERDSLTTALKSKITENEDTKSSNGKNQ